MKEIEENYFDQMKYKYIFDYYDEPLFFISYDHEKYNLFYFIDFETFFITDLNKIILNKVFSGDSIFNILNYIYNADLLNVLSLKHGFKEYSFKEYEKEFSIDLKKFFPQKNNYIEKDYITNKDFKYLQTIYKENFPEFYNIQDISIRLKDKNNSKSLPVDYILKSIKFMNSLFQDFKSNFERKGNISNSELHISSLSPGSVKINFNIYKNPEKLFSDSESTNFDDLITFINDLYVENQNKIYKTDISENRSIINTTNQYFSFLSKNNINVDFDNNDTQIATLTLNHKTHISKKLRQINKLAEDQSQNEITKDFDIKGEMISTSVRNNSFSFKFYDKEKQTLFINGEFSEDLYQNLKMQKRQILIPKETEIKGKKIYNKLTRKTNYIVNNYIQ